MKISRSNHEYSVSNPTAPAPSAASNQVGKTVSSTPTDWSQLSNLSNYLASALSGSAAHVAKLAKLAAAVSGGQYSVDSYAVSGSIIQHTIEFGGSAYWALST
jgi:anti-sigma28 factor (negative regulator of flagellin synthesis)